MRAVTVLSCALAVAVLGGCRSNVGPSAASETAPAPESLPPLQLNDDTKNLLLTWVGEDGDFHVVEHIADVPAERRKDVRVVVTDQPTGTSSSVYVADLSVKRADGSYAVTSLSRADWEKLGADRRKTRMEALAPQAPVPAKDGSSKEPADAARAAEAAQTNRAADGASAANGKVTAIVYGADWCKPCHDAERYLKSLGVAVTKKNIEESRAAQAEMQQKLAHVNRTGSSIPVIDVMGRIFIGYSPSSLRQAVEAARSAATQKHG